MASSGQSSSRIQTVVERLLSLMLRSQGGLKTSITVFVGAGVSREYGMPTSYEFATRFLQDAVSEIDEDRRKDIENATDDQYKIEALIREFKDQLNNDIAYAFFRRIESEVIADPKTDRILTYDRIIELWRAGYINIVVTTNFDSLIERAVKTAKNTKEYFSTCTIDYSDLSKKERPSLTDEQPLIKITGDMTRSTMLWTHDEFEQKLDDTVIKRLRSYTGNTPILLLGYTASEKPLARLLTDHEMYLASVAPKALADIPTLNALALLRGNRDTAHANATAGEFVEALHDTLYQRTKDRRLATSFHYLKDRLRAIEGGRVPIQGRTAIHRAALRDPIWAFMQAKAPEDRLRVLLGDHGFGKTVLMRELSDALFSSDSVLGVYIPANELQNTSLDQWFARLDWDEGSLSDVCRLVTALDRRLILIVDGVNEITRSQDAQATLNGVAAILDRFDTGHVRALVTCRTEFWNRLQFDFGRAYEGPLLSMTPFTHENVLTALDPEVADRLRTSRHRWFLDLLTTPQTFGLFASLDARDQITSSEFALYRRSLSGRLIAVADGEAALVWLCERLEKTRSVTLNLTDTEGAEAQMETLRALADVGLLTFTRFNRVRFAGDRIGEFLFGSVYLYECKWSEDAQAKRIPLPSFFRSLVEAYQALDSAAIDYRILFLNALIFFVARCDDDEIEALYSDGDPFTHMVIRAAVVQRRTVSVRDTWMHDPLMMAAAFLSEDNIPRLRALMSEADRRFFSEIPFNFTAKLFPEEFLTFIQAYLETLEREGLRLETQRRPTSALLSALMIFVLRNGPVPLLARPEVVEAIRALVARTDPAFLADRLVEAAQDNSRYLFHTHATDKPSDLYALEPYWRDRMRDAISGSVFDLTYRDLVSLINMHSMPFLMLKFLFLRDLQDPRMEGWLEAVFSDTDACAQDFTLAVLGWAGKGDAAFVSVSERHLTMMRTRCPENFFRRCVRHDHDGMSQYDPLVPHVTTLLLRGLPVSTDSLLPERHDKVAFRVGRLAEKTILDFPDETLSFLYEMIKQDVDGPEMRAPLRIAARLYPMIFWAHARRNDAADLFDLSGDNDADFTRVIAQVRDFDWWHNIAFAISSDAHKESLTRWLLALVDAPDLHGFFRTLVDAVANRAPS